MEHPFFSYMYRLRYIDRWSLMRNTVRDNVAEHSFHVALLTHVLCTIANEVYGRNVPTERLVTIALFHDATEMFTGDIPSPVKHHNPQILNNFREIERLAAERLINMVPEELQAAYAPLLPNHSEANEHEVYIKAADLLDAYLKCLSELSAGNNDFAVAKEQILASIKKLDLPEAEYFLDRLMPSFEMTVDELFTTENLRDMTSRSRSPKS